MYYRKHKDQIQLDEFDERILDCIKRGLTNWEICEEIPLAYVTIKNRITRIHLKYKVKNRAQLLVKLLRMD